MYKPPVVHTSHIDREQERERLHKQIRGHLRAMAKANAIWDKREAKLQADYIAAAHERLVELDEK
jgi:hypothetical protein